MRREVRAGSLESKSRDGIGDGEGRKDKSTRARPAYPPRRSGDAEERTWLHLTRSYSPLNIGSDVDVRSRQLAEGAGRDGD